MTPPTDADRERAHAFLAEHVIYGMEDDTERVEHALAAAFAEARQSGEAESFTACSELGYQAGRREALEEAADFVDRIWDSGNTPTGSRIRALAYRAHELRTLALRAPEEK
jgi:ribosomal protein L18